MARRLIRATGSPGRMSEPMDKVGSIIEDSAQGWVMDETALISIDGIEALVADRVTAVPRQRISGEFLAAHDLQNRVHRSGSKPTWIGKVLQTDADSTFLRERDLVVDPKRLAAIDRYAASHLDDHLAQLSGRQLEMEVEPVLAPGGVLKFKLWRVLRSCGPGCWTRAKAVERKKLGGSDRVRGTSTASLELTALPRKITVIGPRQGTASRSDVEGILTPPKIPKSVHVEWVRNAHFTGAGAPGQIAAAVREADAVGSVILLLRGGGGRPDFWPFETSVVGRAIRECRGYVMTALGHEEDSTLADELADHSFAVPRSAAVALAKACASVQKPTSGERAHQTRRNVIRQRFEDLERQRRELSQSRRAVIAERDELQKKLASSERDRQSALDARDRARSDLGAAMLRVLEPTVGHDALARMRDAVHIRYLSALPASLGVLFVCACIVGADGASRVVWASCAALFVGAVVAGWAGARHLSRRAQALLTSGQ